MKNNYVVKEKDLYKLKKITILKNYGEKEYEVDVIGLIAPIASLNKNHDYKIIKLNGETQNSVFEIVNVKAVKNIPIRIREKIEAIGKSLKNECYEKEKFMKTQKDFYEKISTIENNTEESINSLKNMFMEEYNLLTGEIFSERISSNIKDFLKIKLNKEMYEYNEIIEMYIFNNELSLSVHLHNVQYAQEGYLDIVSLEYDHTLTFDVSDKKEIEIVNTFLKKHSLKSSIEEMDKTIADLNKKLKNFKLSISPRVSLEYSNSLAVSIVIAVELDKEGNYTNETVNEINEALEKVLKK